MGLPIAYKTHRGGIVHYYFTFFSPCPEKRIIWMRHNAIDLVGKTSLVELVELLRNALLVLSNETSAVHIGAAVGAPVICILGGGHFGRFLPYVVEKPEPSRPTPIVVVQPMSCFGCNWQCVHPRERGDA